MSDDDDINYYYFKYNLEHVHNAHTNKKKNVLGQFLKYFSFIYTSIVYMF